MLPPTVLMEPDAGKTARMTNILNHATNLTFKTAAVRTASVRIPISQRTQYNQAVRPAA